MRASRAIILAVLPFHVWFMLQRSNYGSWHDVRMDACKAKNDRWIEKEEKKFDACLKNNPWKCKRPREMEAFRACLKPLYFRNDPFYDQIDVDGRMDTK